MHVVVNAAMSADGKLSTRDRVQLPISGPDDFERVNALRATMDAIAVGVGTVLADDPSLTTDAPDEPNPVRVIIDGSGRTPSDSSVLTDAATTIVFVSERAPRSDRGRLAAAGADVVPAGEDRIDLEEAMVELAARDIDGVLVEGGGELIYSCFEAGIVDELVTYVGDMIIGGREAPTLADGRGFTDPARFPDLKLEEAAPINDGLLIRWTVSPCV